MTYLDLMRERYACKKFTGETMSGEQLAAIKEAIRLSPSSLNSQPWVVTVVDDPDLKERLRPAAWDQAQITTCSHLFVLSTVKDPMARFEAVYAAMAAAGVAEKSREGFKAMVDGSVGRRPAEERFVWAQRQIYLAAMSALAAAQDLGLAACPMEGFQPEQFADILALQDAVPTVLVAVGVADDEPRGKVRLAAEHVFRQNV